MGFWQGLYAAQSAQMERDAVSQENEKSRAYDREKFNTTLMENRKELYLKMLAERKEKSSELSAQLGTAVNLGMSETAALALQNTGQLGLFLDQYDKNGKVDPNFVKDLDTTVLNQLKDMDEETVSKALVLGVSTDRDTSDPEESAFAMMEAILGATSSEQLDEFGKKLYAPQSTTSLPSFNVDFGYASGASEAETKNISNEISRKLQVYFKDSFTEDPRTGAIVISNNADPTVAELFNKAEERARQMAFGSTRSKTPTDAAAEVAKSIEKVVTKTKGAASAGDILENFDAVLVDPDTFATNFISVPKVTVPEAPTSTESQVEQMGDALSESSFFSIVDQNAKKRY